jgi:hypothetical protein
VNSMPDDEIVLHQYLASHRIAIPEFRLRARS